MVSGSRRSRNGPSVPAASTFAHAALVFLHGLLLDFSHPLRKAPGQGNSRRLMMQKTKAPTPKTGSRPSVRWEPSRDRVITGAGDNLIGRGRRFDPRRVREVEEFRHVHLGGVTRGEVGDIKPCFNEFQY